MLPPIPIPVSSAYKANEKRYGMARTDVQQCLICLKPINPKTCKAVVLSDDLGSIVDPAIEETGEPYGGAFYVGSDCFRSHPQLRGYEVKGRTP